MKICFWGCIAGALNGNTHGGSELQIAFLAKALAKSGHEVVIIDFQIDEDFITPEGIKVFRINGWNKGIRLIRTFTHRLPLLYSSLKNQKADIYYCRIRDFRHIFAFWAARKNNAKFILHMASDLDAMSFRMRWKNYYIANLGGLWWLFNSILIEIIFPQLLRKADLVLVQHEGQKNILEKRHVKSTLFHNLFDLSKIPDSSNRIHNDFIYVGWLDKRKGFKKFFELVKKAPAHSFKVVGPPRDETGFMYFDKLKSYQNVLLFGELNHADTLFQIANSKGLISTSPMEGFPNIFIEAWACGIPVLSLEFDPGSVIETEKLGICAKGDFGKLISSMNTTRYSDEFAAKAKAYVEQNHVLNEPKIKQINDLFNEVYRNNKTN